MPPAAMTGTSTAATICGNNAIVPGVVSRIRWLSHWHVVRQSWAFFQNDFAGRVAQRDAEALAPLLMRIRDETGAALAAAGSRA